MTFFNTVRTWLSPSKGEQELRALLRASLEIVSTYGAVLERGSSLNSPTIRLSAADLPFNKEQIVTAISILKQALDHPRLRAILIETLSPMEAQQLLSSEFKKSLEAGLVLLDRFGPAAEVDAERKQWDEALKLVEQFDPAARARIEQTMEEAYRNARKNKGP